MGNVDFVYKGYRIVSYVDAKNTENADLCVEEVIVPGPNKEIFRKSFSLLKQDAFDGALTEAKTFVDTSIKNRNKKEPKKPVKTKDDVDMPDFLEEEE